jgi:hypothetical protein
LIPQTFSFWKIKFLFFKKKTWNVHWLIGDFNAKTAVLEDFSEPDETFLNVMDVNVEDGLFRYHIAMTSISNDDNTFQI